MGAAFAQTASSRPPAERTTVAPAAAFQPGDESERAALAPLRRSVTFHEFESALVDLKLIDPQELRGFAAEADGDVSRLTRELIRAGKLTPYQAGALAQGKAKGLLIGNYLVLKKIGQGGMGVVFMARHRLLGQVVAIKILPPSFGRDPAAVLRFRREVAVAGKLNHPNVVAALDANEDRGVHFLAMQYIEGHNLDDLVRKMGPLPINLTLDCMIHAARGLEAAHAQGIIHRDIKPGNLMLDDSGTVRVLDLARVIETTNAFGPAAGGSLTRSGTFLGTVDFMAPEQAEDSRTVDHRADIYSLGCTLYFLLTARPPFGGDTVLRRVMAHQEQPAPSLKGARPDVPVALDAAYQKMMAKKPAERLGSMRELIAVIEACRSPGSEAADPRASLKTFGQTALLHAAPPRDQARERGQHRGTEMPVDPDDVHGGCRVHEAMVTGWQVTPHHQDPVTGNGARNHRVTVTTAHLAGSEP